MERSFFNRRRWRVSFSSRRASALLLYQQATGGSEDPRRLKTRPTRIPGKDQNRDMRSCRLLVLLLSAAFVFAQSTMTVTQLESFVRSSIKLHNPDKDVADSLAKIKVSNKLEDQTVEELRAAGAGPKTIAALKKLVLASAGLSDAPPPPPKTAALVTIPPPSSIEQKQILDQVAEQALNYTENLPNFICTQLTRRHVDQTGTENYTLADTVQEQLTYFDRHETYKVTMVDSRAVTNVEHDQLGGATSSGEFGTMLRYVFEPSSRTEFGWEKWATLRARRMYVFNFRVLQGYSRYSIKDGDTRHEIIAGYHGLVYADQETKSVMRVMMEADSIPTDFPIQQVAMDLNYDLTKIGDREFLLPLKSELHSRRGKFLRWNETEFRAYRKFGTESNITFDAAEPTPDKPPDK
jgi:hypothetical protein